LVYRGYSRPVTPSRDETRNAILAATVASGAGIAFQVGSKATRDALFLSSFGVQSLPAMVMATSLLAILFAVLSGKALLKWGPGRVIPVAFAGSAALLLAEWMVSLWLPKAAAIVVYLHVGCLGGLLISGFWSVINERFDPHTAKHQLGSVSIWGTIGGVLGGWIATRVGRTLPVAAMLPILSAFHLICAAAIMGMRGGGVLVRRPSAEGDAAASAGSMRAGLLVLQRSTYLRGLVALVVLVTVSEGFLDLALKNRVASLADGGAILRFFAIFYAAVSLVSLVIQLLMRRAVMEKLGPARTASALPAGVGLASLGALVFPGLSTLTVAKGTESVLSNTVFRNGYEVLFTPISPRDKRAVKPIADVGAARVGDLFAAGIAQTVFLYFMLHAPVILTALAVIASVAAVGVALRLEKGYVESLERGLRSRAIELDLSEVRDGMTRSIMMKTLGPLETSRIFQAGGGDSLSISRMDLSQQARLAALASKDSDVVRRSLRGDPVPAELAPAVISLLAWDDVARDAIQNLRRAGPDAVEPLNTALLDPSVEFAVRRRVPLVLAVCPIPRALEGLSQGLADRRFEVRYRCGRGLSHLTDLDASLRVAPQVVHEAVLREVDTGAGVWEGRRLLDQFDDERWSPMVDDVIRNRANQSLEHVFTLLALVFPREPLRIAFRGLHAGDPFLRGTALEYLESALPPEIRRPLWPYLDDRRPRRSPRPTDAALEALLRSNESIAIHLDELRRKDTPAG